MDRTPPPVSLAAALALPRTPGRSAEIFIDGDLELRFAARPTSRASPASPTCPRPRTSVQNGSNPNDTRSSADRGNSLDSARICNGPETSSPTISPASVSS